MNENQMLLTKEQRTVHKVNSLVVVHYKTTAPSTNVKLKEATARLLAGTSTNPLIREAARVHATKVASKGTSVGRAVSLQNTLGKKIGRISDLPCETGGYYVLTKDIPEVQAIFDDAERDLEQIKADIIAEYPENMQAVKKTLDEIDIKGIKLSEEIVFPTATAVASGFSIRLFWAMEPDPIQNKILGRLSCEVANKIAAESQMAHENMLRRAHASPVNNLVKQLTTFCDKLRNAERLHTSQFDKLAAELRHCRERNLLNIPEIDAVIEAAAPAAQAKDDNLTEEQRVAIAQTGEAAMEKAADALKALGLA